MNVHMINSLAGFDRLIIDGTVNTMPASGIKLKTNESFIESLNNDPKIYEHSIIRLRVNLIGEISEASNIDEARHFKRILEREGVKPLQTGIISKYCVAYVNILIIKGNKYFVTEESSKSRTEQSMEMIAKKVDEASILVAALRLGNHIIKTSRNNYKDANIAIVDRIFVHRKFRHLGVSTWIHDNLKDIIHTYSMFKPNAVLLAYADFTNEASNLNISEADYLELLHKHYLSRGYSEFSKLFKLKDGLDTRRIMYKLYDTKI